jgi:hypothetical protein
LRVHQGEILPKLHVQDRLDLGGEIGIELHWTA